MEKSRDLVEYTDEDAEALLIQNGNEAQEEASHPTQEIDIAVEAIELVKSIAQQPLAKTVELTYSDTNEVSVPQGGGPGPSSEETTKHKAGCSGFDCDCEEEKNDPFKPLQKF